MAPRDAFGQTLAELGGEREEIVLLNADLTIPLRVDAFAKRYPDRFFQVGLTEQNMMGIAAGLATVGKIPFTTTFAVFATKRVCDQVSISIAYPRLNVKIVGAYAGLMAGRNGATHQAVQDIAIMRSMPNMVVVAPADATETNKATKAIAEYEGPVYFRIVRDEIPQLFEKNYNFRLGKAALLVKGEDTTIIATGAMTTYALEAAQKLRKEKISARVIHMSTLKPIDRESIIQAAEETKAIVTVENHNIIGGLGSAVAEVLVETVPVPMLRIGIRDTFGESGSNEDLLEKYCLDVNSIIEGVKDTIRRACRTSFKLASCNEHS